MDVLTPGADGRVVLPGNRWDLLDDVTPPTPPPVSVVIPYFDAQPALDLVLAALARQTHPASRLQIVVADDGSPRPPRVPAGVTVVTQSDRGFRAAAARNLGVEASDGSVLCFLDGDTVPEPGYVEHASRLPALTADAVVVGRRRHADLGSVTAADLGRWFAGGSAPPLLPEPTWLSEAYAASRNLLDVDDRSYRYVISAVLTCSRSVFAAAGGFDPTFTAYGGEDWEFTHRAFTAGAVLAHEPRAVAWHAGADWAVRSADPGRAQTQKQQETAALAWRLPDAALRTGGGGGGGGGWPWRYPRVVVELTAAAAGLAQPVLDVLPDVGVWTPVPSAANPGPADLNAADPRASDPRRHTGAVPDDVARRAPVRVRITAPVAVADLPAAVARVAAPGPGQVITADGTVQVTAARASNRAGRHGIALGELFDVEIVAPWPGRRA